MDSIDKENNKNTHKLAIVIPAYKAKFLSETLDSIAYQTDKRFCVYIGDDNSPEGICQIVSRYEGKFNYVYHRFKDNIGGKDLVAQWERCIEMTQGEEWIWLFSDDDCMDADCVASFYQQIEKSVSSIDLYRFDVQVLKNGEKTERTAFPPKTDSTFLFKNKMNGKCHCFAVEYIFSRSIYYEMGKFQKFDLAWHSDVATWMKFGVKGIVTIKGPAVTWRSSGINITSQFDKELDKRKWLATVDFLMWLRTSFYGNSLRWQLYTDLWFIRLVRGTARNLPLDYCKYTSREYIGNGIRKIILSIIIFGLKFIR